MSKTVLLIHGAWHTPASWVSFTRLYERLARKSSPPPRPYQDRAVSALLINPDPRLARVTIRKIVERYAAIIEALDEPPILIGHIFGGLGCSLRQLANLIADHCVCVSRPTLI